MAFFGVEKNLISCSSSWQRLLKREEILGAGSGGETSSGPAFLCQAHADDPYQGRNHQASMVCGVSLFVFPHQMSKPSMLLHI